MPGKVKYYQLSDKEKKEYLSMFYGMVENLNSREEIKNFFKDLLTPSEVVMIARRLEVASLLLEGYSHIEIKTKMKIGFTTIANVERWLRGGFGGYEKTIKKYRKDREKKTTEKSVSAFDRIRRKYPAHFLLCNALMEVKKRK